MRAFPDLAHLVSFGPRPPGSKSLEQSRRWIFQQLRSEHLVVDTDSFVALTPLGLIPMANIIAKIPGASSSIMIMAGHYDTKRVEVRFVGANDGASSAAFWLEKARMLARRNNKLAYWLVFFDGEEALQCWAEPDGLYGSRQFVQELSARGILNHVRAVILVDIIADAHLDIHREVHPTPWLTDIVFAEAQRVGNAKGTLSSYGRKTRGLLFQDSDIAVEFSEARSGVDSPPCRSS